MKELERILEETEQYRKAASDSGDFNVSAAYEKSMDIIRKHMNDGWISVEKDLPPNAKHKGALCPRYQVMTRYGVTEGWYNPDYESWFVLVWFMGNDHLDCEIDFERGTCPKVVRCNNLVNDKLNIVTAWRSLPEPYRGWD